jgi:hypothetical protein
MAGVFISYRRNDNDVAAGRLADGLSAILGSDSVFRDIDTLEPGEDYEDALDHALDSCVALIAVIGPRWSSITNDIGSRRLADPNDWVRTEIRQGLARGVRVIPVLLSGTIMPRETELPVDLKPLLKHQAFEISDRHWKQDLELLAQALEKIPGISRHFPPPVSSSPVATEKVTLVGSKQLFPLIKIQMVVFIDDKEVGRMKLTDELPIEVEPGAHNIYAKMPLNASNTVAFELQRGETRTFLISQNALSGRLRIEPSKA